MRSLNSRSSLPYTATSSSHQCRNFISLRRYRVVVSLGLIIITFYYLLFSSSTSSGKGGGGGYFPTARSLLSRNWRNIKAWIREKEIVTDPEWLYASPTTGFFHNPSSLIDAALTRCRFPGTPTSTTEVEKNGASSASASASGGNSNHNNNKPWPDTGELFYPPPLLDITLSPSSSSSSSSSSTISIPSDTNFFVQTPTGLHIEADTIPLYVINCPQHANRISKLRESMRQAGFSPTAIENLQVVPCEMLVDIDQDCLVQHTETLFTRSGLRRGEAGVCIAHMRAWEWALRRALAGLAADAAAAITTSSSSSSGTPTHTNQKWFHALFLEDDSTFATNAVDTFQSMLNIIQKKNEEPIHMFALWNGDWLWNTEKQDLYVNASSVLRGMKEEEKKKKTQEEDENLQQRETSTSPTSSSSYSEDRYQIWRAKGDTAYIPGGVAYMLSLTQIQILLTHIFPIDKPLDALLATASKSSGGHFLVHPAEPRVIDKRIARGTPLVWTGGDESHNLH